MGYMNSVKDETIHIYLTALRAAMSRTPSMHAG
jgi:hypothetical protein